MESLEGIETVASIVRAMKEFSHPGEHEMGAVDLNRAIENTVTVARSEWKYVADLVLDLDANLPPVTCHAGEINQVILNIVTNAAHAIGDAAGENGGAKGVIHISTSHDGEFAEVHIGDSGGGIPENVRDRVFEHFFTTKEVGRGTGQGLSIAHSVVQKHEWTITFYSGHGQGTTFKIRLPLEGCRESPTAV